MFCLLFQQLAMAAYVCAMPSPCADVSMQAAANHGSDVHTGDPRCAEHCADHTSATPDARLPTVPPLLLPADWPALTDTLVDRPDLAALPDTTLLRPDPPPSLRYCTLLI
jgi:hypothetical protein